MSDEDLTISAAVQRFEVSRKTIRRRLAEGAIEGARQRPGDHGPEWVFPASSIAALGYSMRDAEEPEPAPAPAPTPAAGSSAAPQVVPSAGGSGTVPEPVMTAEPDAPADTPSGTVATERAVLPRDSSAKAAAAPEAALYADPTPRGSEPRRRRFVALAVVLLLGLIAGVLLAGLLDRDTDAEPVGALLAAVTADGDEIGVLGSPRDADIPAGRVPVPVSEDDLADLDALPRYLIAGGDAAPGAVATLEAGARTLLTLERPSGPIRVFDTGEGADAPVPSATVTTAPPETAAPPSTAGTATIAPTTAVVTPTAPAATPSTNPEPEVEAPPAADPGDPEGGTDDPAPTAGTSRTVVDGEHFWSIAEDIVADALGQTPTDAQVTGYWVQLLDANADILVESGNFDLLLPGQVLELPPV